MRRDQDMDSPDALLTCAQMGHADHWTIENTFAWGIGLMENAGTAVARIVLEQFGDRKRAIVLCGPGNNGGDGYIAARILREAGMEVTLHAFGDPRPDTDAAIAAARCDVARQSPDACDPLPQDVLVDAVFGAGLTRGLPENVVAVFDKARASGCAVVAVDLPSGVNGDSGADLGGALRANATVTFFRRKPGHLLYPGRDLCGDLTVANIGVSPGVFRGAPPVFFANAPGLWRDALPSPGAGAHKYSRGHAAVFSGPRHATGAARLSAMAAQRAGAGAVTILGAPDALDIHAAHLTSIMLRACGPEDGYAALKKLKGCRGCVLGPGFGDFAAARAVVAELLLDVENAARLVLDADGITAFASEPEALFAAAAGGEARLVLTPHEGEFGRLFPDLAANAALSKLDKALRASKRANAVVLYKGPDTVIASPDGRAAINSNGTPALATAGSGDLLAGIIAGLLAQGMPVWEAACAAAWLHGEAGRASGPLAIAEDLAGHIAGALTPLMS